MDERALPVIHVGVGVAGGEAAGARGDYSTIEGNEVPLKVVCWNVAGISARDIDTFLGGLDEELQWDILILPGCSVARRELLPVGFRHAGHLVAAQPFANSRRAGALVFHRRLSPWFHTAALLGPTSAGEAGRYV